MDIHPTILRKNGKEAFVVLPYEEFLALQDRLAAAEDVLELRRAKQEEAASPTQSLEEVKRRFGI